MSAFPNPYNGNIERKMTHDELIQAILQDIAGELEAVFTYGAHILATDDKVAKQILGSIKQEEEVHIGELYTLLVHLDPTFAESFLDGNSEAKKIINGTNETMGHRFHNINIRP